MPGTGTVTSERRAGDARGSEAAAEHQGPSEAAASEGPLVSDEQWNADRGRSLRLAACAGSSGFDDARSIDHGEGEAVLYVPILAHVEVIYARQLRDFGRDHRVVTYRRPEATDGPATHRRPRRGGPRACSTCSGSSGRTSSGAARGPSSPRSSRYAEPSRSLSLVMVSVGMRHKVPPVPSRRRSTGRCCTCRSRAGC